MPDPRDLDKTPIEKEYVKRGVELEHAWSFYMNSESPHQH
jgi:hypothetical protein